jgi:uncharacterized protein with GYD domain
MSPPFSFAHNTGDFSCLRGSRLQIDPLPAFSIAGAATALKIRVKPFWREAWHNPGTLPLESLPLISLPKQLDETGFRHYPCTGEGLFMPKYLIQATYTTEGIQGLVKDSASGRRADVQSAVKALGGKVDAFYYAFGADDVITILDLPDNVAAAAMALTTSGSGAVHVRTTPLLTVEDVDKALEIKMQYRAPGQ